MDARAVARKLRDRSAESLHRLQLRTGLARLERTLERDRDPQMPLIRQLAQGWGNQSWSASLQLLLAMLEWLPRTTGPILECGSGLSTLVLAVAAAPGRPIVSLEHDEHWASRMREALPKRLECRVSVRLAPIKAYGEFDWYAVEASSIPPAIGFVLCDGPPGSTRGGRYGLGPVLAERMADGCIVLLDDTQRAGEHAIVQRWCAELGASVVYEGATFTVLRVARPVHSPATPQNVANAPPSRDLEVPASPLRIIALAPNDWDGMWMNRQQLLSRLGTIYPILYSTGARSTWDRELFSRGAGGWFGRFAVRDAVMIDHPPLLPMRVPNIASLDAAAIRLLARRWRRKLSAYGKAPLVAYLFHPDYEVFLDALAPDFLVYHAYDLLSRSPAWSAATEHRQARLLEKADLVIASSKVIADELTARSGREVHVVPNGVDFEAFARPCDGTEPEDLAALPHPRIAHVGRLNRKIDIELVMRLAREHPQWSFALIGPVVDLDAKDAALYEEAKRIDNVHFLGTKTREELPRYMHAIDVGLLVYRTGVLWTEGIYPLKLHEYLASGLPIVSADIPAVRDFAEVVRTARTVDQWSASIAAAIEDTGAERRDLRIQIARANSWWQRAKTIAGLLRNEIKARRRAPSPGS